MHAGRRIREDVKEVLHVKPSDRLREEDLHTDHFIRSFPIRIVAKDSRFEYDLNRAPERTVYDKVKKSWNRRVWERELTPAQCQVTLAKYHEFHQLVDVVFSFVLKPYNIALVFDIHFYNFQRDYKTEWYNDRKPEINVGTKAVNRPKFAKQINLFIQEMADLKISGRPIRVAENEVFFGGYLSRRLSAACFDRILVLSIEFKKIFMDEWSGSVDKTTLDQLIGHFETIVKQLLSTF